MIACTILSHDEALALLRARVADYPTMSAAAAALGVSIQYLTDVVKGRRDIGPKIAQALALEQRVVYLPVAS